MANLQLYIVLVVLPLRLSVNNLSLDLVDDDLHLLLVEELEDCQH